MKRTFFLILTVLLVVAGSTAPVIAKDNGKDQGKNDNKTVAESCKKDGWKDLTDEDGDPFKNQGQCVTYAKQGGDLGERDDDNSKASKNNDNGDDDARDEQEDGEPSLKIVDGTKPWDGYLEGTGFTPGEEITKVTFESDRETLVLDSPVGTVIDDDGSFQTERIIYWCSQYHGHGEASGTVTVEDSAGITHSETFQMDTHCGPKE